jgi:hypothetical protein
MDKLSKEKYLNRKKQGLTDMIILKEFRMGSNTLRKKKLEWGLVEPSNRLKSVVSAEEVKVVGPSPSPEKESARETELYREHELVLEYVNKLQAENEKLKALLRHYL